MSKVDIIDAKTTRLMMANNDIPLHIITKGVQNEMIVITIPATLNYHRFIKSDGTMNMNDVLAAVFQEQ